MKASRYWGLAAATAAVFTLAAGSAAIGRQAFDPDLVVYSYVFYSDETMTEFVAVGQDTCNPGPPPWVSRPTTMTTPWYDAIPQYQCSASGPYLPPGWPY